MTELRGLPDFGLTVYSCKYQQCARKSLKLTTSLNLGVGRRGIKVRERALTFFTRTLN